MQPLVPLALAGAFLAAWVVDKHIRYKEVLHRGLKRGVIAAVSGIVSLAVLHATGAMFEGLREIGLGLAFVDEAAVGLGILSARGRKLWSRA